MEHWESLVQSERDHLWTVSHSETCRKILGVCLTDSQNPISHPRSSYVTYHQRFMAREMKADSSFRG